MFVKKVFQLVKPFLANLHSTSSNIYSYMYSMTPIFFCSFVAYEYPKFAEFYADFKSVEIIGKKSTQKKLFAKHFCKLVVQKRRTSDFSHFFLAVTFLIANFSHFSQQFRNQHKFLGCFDNHIQILQRKSFYVILALF